MKFAALCSHSKPCACSVEIDVLVWRQHAVTCSQSCLQLHAECLIMIVSQQSSICKCCTDVSASVSCRGPQPLGCILLGAAELSTPIKSQSESHRRSSNFPTPRACGPGGVWGRKLTSQGQPLFLQLGCPRLAWPPLPRMYRQSRSLRSEPDSSRQGLERFAK